VYLTGGAALRDKMEKHTSGFAYIAAVASAAFSGLTLHDVALGVGIFTAIGTFLVNWYYKERDADRADARANGK